MPSRRFPRAAFVPAVAALFASLLVATPAASSAEPTAELIAGFPVVEGELPAGLEPAPLQSARSFDGEPLVGLAASTGSGIVATFEPGVPAEVAAIARVALDHWDAALAFDPAVPVEVRFRWEDLGERVLGYGGPTWFVVHSDLGPETWPVALANTLLGADQNSASPEIVIGLNSHLAWHLDPTASPPSDHPDLLSTILHEVGHGLGFVSSLTLRGESLDPALRLRFDRRLHSDVAGTLVAVADLDDRARNNALTTSLVAVSPDGSAWPMYTPETLSVASSVSHFDEELHAGGHAGSLMSPAQALGEAERGLDAPTIAVMAGIGWPLDAPVAAPTGVGLSTVLGGVDVRWSFDHRVADRPAERVRVRVVTGAGETVERVVEAAAGRVTIPGVEVGDFFQLFGEADGLDSVPASPGPADPAVLIVEALYRAAFDRVPDPEGLEFWSGRLRAGEPVATLADQLVGSPEYAAGSGRLETAPFVDHLYRAVLGRRPDADGRAFWIRELDAGRNRGEVIAAFVDTAELTEPA